MSNTAIYARKSTDQNGISDDQKSVARQIEHALAGNGGFESQSETQKGRKGRR